MMQFIFLTFILLLSACAIAPAPQAQLTKVDFAGLDGWRDDHPLAALQALQKSCASLSQKHAAKNSGIDISANDWRALCATAASGADSDDAARDYFEQNFQPYAVSGADGDKGLFTGYYTPELRGSLRQTGAYQTPLYARPIDLISVDLGSFKDDLKGQSIVGKLAGHNLLPYDDRAAITEQTLNNRAAPLVWVDDPIDAFFLQVQGSGRVRLADGSVMNIGYDGANGRAYVAIGRVLADRGDVPRPVTMPAIRAWLRAHPDQAQQIMNQNPSYVFFRLLPTDDVLGAAGVALTPQRSLAVDPAFVPLGLPVWLETSDATGADFHHLMIAQDTGGAIKGVVRGDVFWGWGGQAEQQAGAMQSRGRYFILLPKAVTPHEE